MIRNDKELAVMQERIKKFEQLLAHLRIAATQAEFASVSGGYRAELVRMQNEVLDYLTRHASEPITAEAA